MWPLAVATRFLVEATASRNQPSPQTLLSPLARQGVVDQQGDGTPELETGEDEHANTAGQALGCPGGAFKEVVDRVQAVALGVIRNNAGVTILGKAAERMPLEIGKGEAAHGELFTQGNGEVRIDAV